MLRGECQPCTKICACRISVETKLTVFGFYLSRYMTEVRSWPRRFVLYPCVDIQPPPPVGGNTGLSVQGISIQTWDSFCTETATGRDGAEPGRKNWRHPARGRTNDRKSHPPQTLHSTTSPPARGPSNSLLMLTRRREVIKQCRVFIRAKMRRRLMHVPRKSH